MLNNFLRKSDSVFEDILKFPSLAQLELKKEKIDVYLRLEIILCVVTRHKIIIDTGITRLHLLGHVLNLNDTK